ncbi:MAG: hypothetical protein H8D45_29090 [Bacteroidetes bacterium]|nr:hypothetical protein [Bacteroidota bacterium]
MPENRRQFDEVLEHKLNEILKYNKRQDELISDIHLVIHGNGNPEAGVIVKLTRIDERAKANSNTLKIHWGLLAGIGLAVLGAVLAYVL